MFGPAEGKEYIMNIEEVDNAQGLYEGYRRFHQLEDKMYLYPRADWLALLQPFSI
jgi:hypothetical protein